MPKNLLAFFILLAIPLLGGCVSSNNSNPNQANKPRDNNPPLQSKNTSDDAALADFSGIKGVNTSLVNGHISIDTKQFNDNKAHYFNTKLNGKTIYFFIVKDKNGVYRAAANGCQVCHNAQMGFTQTGDYMVCNTCGNKYPLEKIATEKGGCNPGPINPNLEVNNGKLIIDQADLEQVTYLF